MSAESEPPSKLDLALSDIISSERRESGRRHQKPRRPAAAAASRAPYAARPKGPKDPKGQASTGQRLFRAQQQQRERANDARESILQQRRAAPAGRPHSAAPSVGRAQLQITVTNELARPGPRVTFQPRATPAGRAAVPLPRQRAAAPGQRPNPAASAPRRTVVMMPARR